LILSNDACILCIMNTKILKISFTLFLAQIFFASYLFSNKSPVLARINNTQITLNEFEKKYNENLKFYGANVPSKEQVLEDLIKREVGIQEAKKLGIDKKPEVIDKMNTVLYQSFLEEKLEEEFNKIVVSDKEASAYYAKNPEIRTSHIYIAVPVGATKEMEQKAYNEIKNILDEYLIKKKMNFIEVAQKYSQGLAAPMGGDIDYQTSDKLDKAYYSAALKLKMNEVSPIVQSQIGFHIIKLTGKKSWNETDQAKIKRIVFEQKKQSVFDRFMTRLKGGSKITINSALLKN